MKINEFLERLEKGLYDKAFAGLYSADSRIVEAQKIRYKTAAVKFSESYPQNDEIEIYSASGRTEVGGNHTDHQRGCVLAAAVDVDAIAVVSFNESGVMRILSEGYDEMSVSCSDLGVRSDDHGTAALMRGVASRFKELGVEISGFDMYVTSDVLAGSGISSSAAFETLLGTVVDKHYNEGRLGAVEIAKIGQYAENVYFGKKSGLMDQTVSAVGGFVFIDFCDTENPVIESCTFDFDKAGYTLFITDTKGSHVGLNDEYSAVPAEMRQVAQCFGKEVLRQVDEDEFLKAIPELRTKCSDRAIMRAMHFFDENKRARAEFEALKKGDVKEFLRLVQSSGDSSARLLQNIYAPKKPLTQEISLALAISRKTLGEEGAERVHGGGFAGTIQSFVPNEAADAYKAVLDGIFGEGSCRRMGIRPVGGISFLEYAENL